MTTSVLCWHLRCDAHSTQLFWGFRTPPIRAFTHQALARGSQTVPEVQAHSARPCDTGSEIAILRSEFHDLPWETMQLDDTFPEKKGLYAADPESLRLRGVRIQRQLKEHFQRLAGTNRPDIVVVTHGGFLRFVSGDDRIEIGQARWRTFMVTFNQSSGIVIESSE
ncbi:Histidine phosphatase superfamily [Penicillium brevicompactum]